MIHEVLLALSGHPSPLFTSKDRSHDDLPYLSPSEKALLSSLGQLSELHRGLREKIERIASTHPWSICRAVATSIQQIHLLRFQDKIVSVESKILTKDATVVGAYDIVPLAGLVGQFDDWQRLMSWYWEIACFTEPAKSGSTPSRGCSGAGLIDKLRSEQQTGWPGIEEVAFELSKVAETAWIRQLSSWVLYGKLPTFGADDFFIKTKQDVHGLHFSKNKDLLPKFVTSQTATSILFVGKSLVQVREYGRQSGTNKSANKHTATNTELVQAHLQHLTQLPLPISSAQLTRTIFAIRTSLSQNVLQDLLPMETTMKLFTCLKQFFLLERGSFAIALIAEADARLQSREQSMGRLLQQDPTKAMKGLSIKDSELQQTLTATWKALASKDDDGEDEVMDFAERHMTLSAPATHESRPSTCDSIGAGSAVELTTIAFNDLLMPNPATLGMDIASPLDLVISQNEIQIYSSTSAYLLALRRAQVRLSDMWRRSIARRDNAASRKASKGTGSTADRIAKRRVAARKVWATCSAAIFLLSELSAYFESEIIRESWDRFESWARQNVVGTNVDDSTMSIESSADSRRTQHDPETLAAGHRAFLASLTYALLLNDYAYVKDLRQLLGNVDQLIAFFNRLLDVQLKLDIANDADEEHSHTMEEERRISLELDRARKNVDSDLKATINRLKQLDNERIGAGRYLNTASQECDFEPWKGGGVDRLLMKLEFGRMTVDEYDVVCYVRD